MRNAARCCLVVMGVCSSAIARADDRALNASDLGSAVTYVTSSNSPRQAFQSPVKLREAGDALSVDMEIGLEWTRAARPITTDKDFGARFAVTGTIDPRPRSWRGGSDGGLALQLRAGANVGQEDKGAATATRDTATLEASLKKDLGHLEAEFGVAYGMAAHDREADTASVRLGLSMPIDLRQASKTYFRTLTQSVQRRNDDATDAKRALTPFVGIEQSKLVHGPAGHAGRDFAVTYGVTYEHELMHDLSFDIRPAATWDHDQHDTVTTLRLALTWAIGRGADVAPFMQLGHGSGHQDAHTTTFGVTFGLTF